MREEKQAHEGVAVSVPRIVDHGTVLLEAESTLRGLADVFFKGRAATFNLSEEGLANAARVARPLNV